MPKRLPGGKMKRGTKPARSRVPQGRPPGAGAADADVTSTELAAAHAPVRRPLAPARQSLLTTVRRPLQKSGPALATDYSYVMSDLKRIAVVSVGALVLLVVLSFVVR
jgi:hypothetical protein